MAKRQSQAILTRIPIDLLPKLKKCINRNGSMYNIKFRGVIPKKEHNYNPGGGIAQDKCEYVQMYISPKGNSFAQRSTYISISDHNDVLAEQAQSLCNEKNREEQLRHVQNHEFNIERSELLSALKTLAKYITT